MSNRGSNRGTPSRNSAKPPSEMSDIAYERHMNDNSNDTAVATLGEIDPRPTHFLARPDEKFTPLIPVDELPSNITIIGVPTYVSQEELLRVKGTGCFPMMMKSGNPYIFDVGEEGEIGDVGQAGQTSESGNESFQDHGSMVNVPNTMTRDARIDAALRLAKSRKAALKGASGNQVYNPTTPGVLGTKVYCTHWMRTGECDFTQQGCMFLHVMPDLDTLELLGFRSYPRWFREMPREWQMQNCKTFDEAGLDPHRFSHGRSGPQGYGGPSLSHSGGGGFNRGGGIPPPGNYPPPRGPGFYGGFGGSPQGFYGGGGPGYGRGGYGYPPPPSNYGPPGPGGPGSVPSTPLGPAGPGYGPPGSRFGSVAPSDMSSIPGSPYVGKMEPGAGPPQHRGTNLSSPAPSVADWKTLTPQAQAQAQAGWPPGGQGPMQHGPGGPYNGGPMAPHPPATPDIIHPKRFTDPKFGHNGMQSEAPDARGKTHDGAAPRNWKAEPRYGGAGDQHEIRLDTT